MHIFEWVKLCCSFKPHRLDVLTGAGDGEVYVWDVRSRQCVHKFTDEGASHSTALAVSPDGRRIACGWGWLLEPAHFHLTLSLMNTHTLSLYFYLSPPFRSNTAV
jgi:WD40 repeat protein